MATTLTRNLKLRLDDNLTADARYNLLRIDQLAATIPAGSSGDQTINSSGDIRLRPQSSTFGGDNDGTVFAPSLELDSELRITSGQYKLTLVPGTLTADLSLTFPSDAGDGGQFLTTDGTGTLSWADAPTANLSSLNDVDVTGLTAGQLLSWDGAAWTPTSIAATNSSGTFTWTPADGTSKTISHGFGSSTIMVYIYDSTAKCQVFVDTIDYVDNDTILLTSDDVPLNDYTVMLQQVSN